MIPFDENSPRLEPPSNLDAASNDVGNAKARTDWTKPFWFDAGEPYYAKHICGGGKIRGFLAIPDSKVLSRGHEDEN